MTLSHLCGYQFIPKMTFSQHSESGSLIFQRLKQLFYLYFQKSINYNGLSWLKSFILLHAISRGAKEGFNPAFTGTLPLFLQFCITIVIVFNNRFANEKGERNLIQKKWTGAVVCALAALTVFSGCSSASATSKADLNSMSVDQITAEAKKEGRVDSVGMPDSWANWVETWQDLKTKYGIDHSDTDMSSAEELSIFESEKGNATKDIGDVGQAFGPIAVSKGLTLPYKTSYWKDIPDWAKDKDGNWALGYYGTMSIIVNTKLIQNPPKSFADILNGNYKVAVGDVTKASQAQNAVLSAAIANGGSESDIQPGLDYFKKLAQQGRLDKGELTIARLQKGEIAVAFLWDYNALNYRTR